LFNLAFEIVGKAIHNNDIHWDLRPNYVDNYAVFILFISFLLLSATKLSTPFFLTTLKKSVLKNRSIEKVVLDENPLSQLSAGLLVVNFLICSSLYFYINLSQWYPSNLFTIILISILSPFYLYYSPTIYLIFVEFIVGEKGITLEVKLTTKILFKAIGILLFFFLVVLLFNKQVASIVNIVILMCIAFIYAFRIYRGLLLSISKRLNWYYIFLYLCTFEILPFYIIWSFLKKHI
jgi:hypothetical protein